MKSRLIAQGLLVTAGIVAVLSVADSRRARAQEGCPLGQVCNPVPCGFSEDSFLPLETTPDCTTQVATFTPTMDTWTYIFDSNNAIKIGTDVTPAGTACPVGSFVLKVDMITISQGNHMLGTGYAGRRKDPEFADTVCNPTALDGVNCVFYRVHGETVPRACYGAKVEYR